MGLIIFDFDGTIADSFDYVSAFLAREAGRTKPLTKTELAAYRHLSMKDMALELGIPFWRLPYVYFKGRRVMRGHMLHVQPFSGMPHALQQLHQQGHTLGIVSSNSTHNIKQFLKHQQLSQYFSGVKGGAGLLGKVGLIKQLQRRFPADASWYIGDEVTDIASAKAAGCYSLAVSWGFAARESLERFEPTAIVDQASQIPATIKGHGH